MNTTQFFLHAWTLSPVGICCAAAMLGIYLWRVGWNPRAWWMISAAALVLVTLCSPLAVLAQGYLFSAHMTQHSVLLLLVPAMALLALPRGMGLFANAARRLPPSLSWISGIAAMWIWHAPALCNAAATSRTVSAVQTVSLLALGGAFWWQLLAPSESQRISPLQGVLYLFSACVACSALGIIVTFSPVTVCQAYVHPVDALGIEPMIMGTWGMNPLHDQQIGGLIMWVPMCMVYLGAIFGQLARWYGAPHEPAHA
jgi:putative membrane protein